MELQINTQEQKVESSNIIKVIGIGGAGNNAVNHMYENKVVGIDYVICNTDIQDLEHSSVPVKLQLGKKLTEGLGAGSIPQFGKDAAEESAEDIRNMLSGSTRMVILTAGMGGGTGTGASPFIAKVAQDMGLVVVSIVTTPFGFERQRLREAVAGISELEEVSDALLIINNQKLQQMYGDLSFPEACAKANDVLVMAAKSISEIVTQTAEQNIDYADLERMLRGSGMAVFGVGSAKGSENRVGEAIKNALYSPLLDNCDIMGAQNLLVNVVLGAPKISLEEHQSIGSYMRRMAGAYREMKQGIRIDSSLEEDEIVVTIIATNFSEDKITGATNTEADNIELIYPPKNEKDWLEVENTKEIEEREREKRERKKQLKEERERMKEEAERRKQQTEQIAEVEEEKEFEEDEVVQPEKKKRIDPIERYKRKKTHTKKANGVFQKAFDFFNAEDMKDEDVSM